MATFTFGTRCSVMWKYMWQFSFKNSSALTRMEHTNSELEIKEEKRYTLTSWSSFNKCFCFFMVAACNVRSPYSYSHTRREKKKTKENHTYKIYRFVAHWLLLQITIQPNECEMNEVGFGQGKAFFFRFNQKIQSIYVSMCLSIWRGERENSRKWVFFNSAFASVSFSKFPSTIFRSCANGPTVVNRKCVYLCVWWPFFPFAIRSYHFHHPFLSHLYISLSLSAFHSLVSFECLIIFA